MSLRARVIVARQNQTRVVPNIFSEVQHRVGMTMQNHRAASHFRLHCVECHRLTVVAPMWLDRSARFGARNWYSAKWYDGSVRFQIRPARVFPIPQLVLLTFGYPCDHAFRRPSRYNSVALCNWPSSNCEHDGAIARADDRHLGRLGFVLVMSSSDGEARVRPSNASLLFRSGISGLVFYCLHETVRASRASVLLITRTFRGPSIHHSKCHARVILHIQIYMEHDNTLLHRRLTALHDLSFVGLRSVTRWPWCTTSTASRPRYGKNLGSSWISADACRIFPSSAFEESSLGLW